MKKGLLRTLSALMAVSMLLCMSMVAFADGQTYNVTTTYDGTNVTVETEVIGAVPSEQVAFLVEKTTGENTEIIWIDQQTAKADTTAKSTFTAAEGVAVGAKVKVGTTSLAASNFGDAKSIALPNYTVTWDVVGSNNSKVVAVVGGVDDVDGSVTTSNKVTFYVFPAADAVLSSVTYGGNVDSTFIGNSKEYAVTANTAFTFTFAAKNVASAPKPGVPSSVPSGVADTADGKKAASVTATATNASEFGLLVAVKGTADWSDVTIETIDELGVNTAPIRKYEALGANADGQFVIQLKDTEGVFFVDNVKYEACVYANGSELTLGSVFDLN